MSAFEEMFARYFGQVYRFALKLTRDTEQAEELTQQTFFKALKKIDSFQGRSDPRTWLCSIAKHEYLNQRRKRETPFPHDDAALEQPAKDCTGDVERQIDSMMIHRHLHELDEPYREVFMLRIFGELKYAQIASLFGKSDSWARVTYYRAKLELQKRIEEERL